MLGMNEDCDPHFPDLFTAWQLGLEETQINGERLSELLPEAVPSGGSRYLAFVNHVGMQDLVTNESAYREMGWAFQPVTQFVLCMRGRLGVLRHEGTCVEVVTYTDAILSRSELQFIPARAVLMRLPPPKEPVDDPVVAPTDLVPA